jgi:glycosyltransferase involved in cell wall biosynthesis
MKAMKLLFDATVMQIPATGIAKTSALLYHECLNVQPSLKIIAAHQRPLLTSMPKGIESVQLGTLLPKRLWRKVALPLLVSSKTPAFLHFPWNGNVPKTFSKEIVITTLHDVLPLEIPGHFQSATQEQKYRQRVQSDINRSDLVFTDSEYSRKQILGNFSVKNPPVVLMHGPTITSCNASSSGRKTSRDYYLYVGGYDRRKGLESLLRVFTALSRANKLSCRLVLTGNRQYFSEAFRRLVDEGNAIGIVEEKGYVPDDLLFKLYNNAKALIYPSKYEGFGLPPLEAMYAGCPVVTTRCTAIPEICGDAAYYIDPDDEEDFAQGLLDIEHNDRLRADLSEKGLKQSGRFSWHKTATCFLHELEKAMRHKKSVQTI